MAEAPHHPHNAARNTFVKVGEHYQPAPAPRFSGTPSIPPRLAPRAGADSVAILKALGRTDANIADLKSKNIVG